MLSPRKVLVLAFTFVATLATAADYKPGEVIVKYKTGATRTRTVMNSLYDSVGVKKVFRFQGIMKGMELLTLQSDVKVQDAIAALRSSGSVEFAQPNYIMHIYPNFDHIASNPHPVPAATNPPCVPGMEVPNCDPNACVIPGVFPPGCEGGNPANPGNPPTGPGEPSSPGTRPIVAEPPAEMNPPVADPELDKAYGIVKVGAVDAWKSHRGSKNFIVADIDTGIDYNHEDLSLNIWRNPKPTQNDLVGYDFVHNDGLPFDDNLMSDPNNPGTKVPVYHGTHTAGTIGAVGGNGKGVSGVIQKVSIMSLKFLSGEGQGTTSDAIKAIDYAVTHGAKVLNNSWGGAGTDTDHALTDAIQRARDKDVLFIAAAGNGNSLGQGMDNDQDPVVPASLDSDNIITVAATDKTDELAIFSNYGVKSVHLAAPGVDVYSTMPGNKYQNHSGTSMACPHVAGAAALIWSKHPDWDYKRVKSVLLSSVDKLPSLAGKTVTGGRLNVLKALEATN